MTLTKFQIGEYLKCAEDIVYFAENYYSVADVNKGLVKVELRRKQKTFLKAYQESGSVNILGSRQSRKSTTLNIIALWTTLFKQYQVVGLIAPKTVMCKVNIQSIKQSYEALPEWFKMPVVWKKTSVEFSNGSEIVISKANGKGFRGMAISVLIYDEMGYSTEESLETFFGEVRPALVYTKIVCASSMNTNKPFETYFRNTGYQEWIWSDKPELDNSWKLSTIEYMGVSDFNKFYENRIS